MAYASEQRASETDPVWTSEKASYYTKTESDTIYEPILPATPTNPAIKYLNGNKEWAVAIGEIDRIVIDNITPQTFTLTRTDGSVSKIEYNNGRTVNITRSDGAISYWEDENWRWTINRTDDTITGITVTEV
jgi:asparagine N-glycosylation enzyme membrane subunit Stt3